MSLNKGALKNEFITKKMVKMKIIQKQFLMIMFGAFMLFGCEDKNVTEDDSTNEVDLFMQSANSNPVFIDGFKLGDSWRVIGEKYAYNDGEYRKEGEVDYLTDPEYSYYKKYWAFDRERVLFGVIFTEEGELYFGDKEPYKFEIGEPYVYEIVDQSTNLEKRMVSIHYIYDDGSKTYTRHWTITSLTETELILTEEIPEEDYFYQYTFRREKFN